MIAERAGTHVVLKSRPDLSGVGSSKSRERCIAEDLGGRRVSVWGRGRGDASDSLHPTLSVEVKGCKKLTPGIE